MLGFDSAGRLSPIVRVAPAKLNLTLAVVGRRSDGYHALHSVMLRLTLADRLSLSPGVGGRDSLHVTGADTGPPEDNLVTRALEATREAARRLVGPAALPALAVLLEKRIPIAAGLGGGSSDAAATMDAALDAWQVKLGQAERLAVAARLGSDVPFFLAGGPAVVEGRGELVTPLPGLSGPSPGVLLVTPAVTVSTSDVFALFAARGRPTAAGAAAATSHHFAVELDARTAARILLTRAGVLAAANDLLPATLQLVPDLVDFRRALARLLGRPIGQSGSGPTAWVLYPSDGEAEVAAMLVERALGDGRLPWLGGRQPAIHVTSVELSPADLAMGTKHGGVEPRDRGGQ